MHPYLFSVFKYELPKNRIFLIFLMAVGLTVASCSKRQFPTSAPVIISDPEMLAFLNSGTQNRLNTGRIKPNQVISTAEKFVGTPHCMGGTTARCMDCSGLTYTSFGAHKIMLPRRSQDQARYGRIIFDRNDLKRGDLVFFTKSYNSPDYITHVGIYMGSDRFLHASSSQGVIVSPLSNPWWSQRFVFGTRVFNR
jgi:murein DD-endopeptidase / murein LD-carboxypeptidase